MLIFSQFLGGGLVAFLYDPFGRRIEKSGPSGTTIYAYDGANGIEELNTSGTASARYVQGAGIDEPLAQAKSSLSYFSADGLGSVTSLEDASGTPQATFVYGAFGVVSVYRPRVRSGDGTLLLSRPIL